MSVIARRPSSFLVFLFAIFGGLGLSGCGSSESYRYRMTVEVDTPQGVRSGSSVIQVVAGEGPRFPGPEAGQLHSRVRGEAVAVDLPNSETLFALLESPTNGEAAKSYAFSAYAQGQPELRDLDWRQRILALKRQTGPADLPDRIYPILVRFRDVNDPASIELVDPTYLAGSFGRGYALRRIIAQITDDRVTDTIEDRLRWLETGYELPRTFRPHGIPVGDYRGLFTTNN